MSVNNYNRSFVNDLPSPVNKSENKNSSEDKKVEQISKKALNTLEFQTDKVKNLKDSYIYCHYYKKQFVIDEKKLIEESGFSQFEAKCVILYTTNAYTLINARFRGQDKIFEEQVENFKDLNTTLENVYISKGKNIAVNFLNAECDLAIQGITEGFTKLPRYTGDVFRGDMLSEEELEQMEKGFYSDKAVFSCSTKNDKVLDFAIRKPKNSQEKYPAFITVKNSTNGSDSSLYSAYPQEAEVAFPPGQKFKVVSISEAKMKNSFSKKAKVKVIELEEMKG